MQSTLLVLNVVGRSYTDRDTGENRYFGECTVVQDPSPDVHGANVAKFSVTQEQVEKLKTIPLPAFAVLTFTSRTFKGRNELQIANIGEMRSTTLPTLKADR